MRTFTDPAKESGCGQTDVIEAAFTMAKERKSVAGQAADASALGQEFSPAALGPPTGRITLKPGR